MIRITIAEADKAARASIFNQSSVSIGRETGNDIVLRDQVVSSRHGQIRFEDSGVTYEDLKTTNGSLLRRQDTITRIDRRLAYKVRLERGDELLLGSKVKPIVLTIDMEEDTPDAGLEAAERHRQTTTLRVARSGDLDAVSADLDREALLALQKLCSRLAASLELDFVLAVLAECVLDAFPKATHVAVYLLEEESGEYRSAIERSKLGWVGPQPLSRAVKHRVLVEGEAVAFSELESGFDASESLLTAQIHAGLCAPLWNGEITIGFIQVDRRGDRWQQFDARDLGVFAVVAHQAAFAIERARLHARLKATIEQSVLGLVRTLEAKDRYASGHSQAVGALCQQVAETLDLCQEDIQTITHAALVHDLGKMGIPDRVLNKDGALSAEERELIKTHPETGAEILQTFGFLSPLVCIVRHHHERWDGKGYPDGLAGSKIPLGARILAVADAYHSLVSNRAYRHGRAVEIATEELRACRGSQFDPEVVDALITLVESGTNE
jgi:putative nucleotidyltransferase with HDIG domain